MVRLVESEIRDKSGEVESLNSSRVSEGMDLGHYADGVFIVCRKYVAILINLSKLLRFHRNNHLDAT